MRIDLNSDLGESFGPWRMGDDAGILDDSLKAHSICVHGDGGGAVAMARHLRSKLQAAGATIEPGLPSPREGV